MEAGGKIIISERYLRKSFEKFAFAEEKDMAKHVKQSVLPIYLVGGVWLIWGMFFSLHRVTDYAICTAVSAAAFAAGKAIFPDKSYQIPGEPEEKKEERDKKEKKKEEKPKTIPEIP